MREEERQESIAAGFSSYWDVYADYEVVGEVLRPVELWRAGWSARLAYERRYLPGAHPRVVAEFARLNVNDHDGLTAFARDWGLLGFSRQVMALETVLAGEREGRLEWLKSMGAEIGDPLPWIEAHLRGVNTCLRLHDLLRSRDHEGIEAYLKSFLPFPSFTGEELKPSEKVSIRYGQRYQVGSAWFRPPEQNKVDPPYTRPEQLFRHAHNIIERIINDNLSGGISPAVRQSEARLGEWRFAVLYDFISLMDMIYWHLAGLVREEMGLEKCRECGQYFIQTHGRQKFCPPDAWESSTAESRCARRHRSRKARNK
ncbi:MAG: hypothetical protein IBX71_09670 [Candidatus Desulforudis sp.]|nr:hypothetical protein [Desulforudis sp.]